MLNDRDFNVMRIVMFLMALAFYITKIKIIGYVSAAVAFICIALVICDMYVYFKKD